MHWRWWCQLPSSLKFSLFFLSLTSTFPHLSASLRVPLHRRADDNSNSNLSKSTRLNFTNEADPFQFGVVNLVGDARVLYFVTVEVDGKDFAVQLDTGSSDLWLDTTDVKFTSAVESTHHTGAIKYGDGTTAMGDILLGEVKFGNFTIPKQAFISATGTNATADGDQGLLGVGPPQLSFVNDTLFNTPYATEGVSLLRNLFDLYPQEQNYMTFSLDRSVFGVTDGGSFSIGEIDSRHEAIKGMPKLPVMEASKQWVVPMDAVVVNGKRLPMRGKLANYTGPGIPPAFNGTLLTLLDSGTALAAAPPYYVEQIYANLPGAEPMPDFPSFYKLPCDTKVNISMIFGGVEYPMNPLDATMVATDNDNVTIICVSTITPTGRGVPDWILGDAFMRNVYALFDFGTYITPGGDTPFAQLLSTTNKDQAWANFDKANTARIESFKKLVVQASSPSPSSPLPSSSSRAGNSWIVIGLLIAILLILLFFLYLRIVKGRNENKYTPLPMIDIDSAMGVSRGASRDLGRGTEGSGRGKKSFFDVRYDG